MTALKTTLKWIILLTLVSVMGCQVREYTRKPEKLWLGPPEFFPFSAQAVIEASAIVLRDDAGWRTLDGRCTYDGCDLSFEGETLYCSCCKSVYNIDGSVHTHPARKPLKFWKMAFEGKSDSNPGNDSLIAHAGEAAAATEHFTNPQLEQRIAPVLERIKQSGPSSAVLPFDFLIHPRKREEDVILSNDAPKLIRKAYDFPTPEERKKEEEVKSEDAGSITTRPGE